MVYWADVFYESPDTNLAAYERVAADLELCGQPVSPWSHDGCSAEQTRSRRLSAP